MKILITCFQGLVPVLNKELKRLKYKPFDTFQTGTYIYGDRNDIYKINLQSRIANKVYMQLGKTSGKQEINNFDDYFNYITNIKLNDIVPIGASISIKVATRGSILHSQRTLQSITHKAIITKLAGKNQHRKINPKGSLPNGQPSQSNFFVKVENNFVELYINTSGISLHNRGYRTKTGEAPLKETIAAALIQMGVRNFKNPLLDPCCGAGTICIEAAMIATNTAPGLRRNFAFQYFPNYNNNSFQKIKTDLQSNIFQGDYEIIGSDIDPAMIEIAKQNTKNAGMENFIKFEVQNILNSSIIANNIEMNTSVGKKIQKKEFFIITNPPYGKRIGESLEIKKIYQQLANLYQTNKGAFISSFDFDNRKYGMKQKEVNNNGEMCMIYSTGL